MDRRETVFTVVETFKRFTIMCLCVCVYVCEGGEGQGGGGTNSMVVGRGAKVMEWTCAKYLPLILPVTLIAGNSCSHYSSDN